MHCTICDEYIEEGKFCPNCGSALQEEAAAITDQTLSSTPPARENNQQEQVGTATNQRAYRSTDPKVSFDIITDYYKKLIKKPHTAIEKTKNDIIPGIISLIIFSLLVGADSYYSMKELSSGFISPSFTSDFLLSFLRFGLILTFVAVITFTALKLTANELPFKDVFAKYTAFLVPFLLLFSAGFILELISLPTIPGSLISISLRAPLLVIPAIIILHSKKKKIDLIYLLVGIYAVAYIVNIYLIEALSSIFS